MTTEERAARSIGALDILTKFMKDSAYISNEKIIAMIEGIKNDLEGVQPAETASKTEAKTVDAKVKPGEKFKFYDLDMVALDVDEDGITAITTKPPIIDKKFDEKGGADWIKSTLRPWLNNEWLASEGIDTKDLVIQKTAIVPDDTNEHACCWDVAADYVQLITCEQYRKYRHFIPDMETFWWTMTPYSVNPIFCGQVRRVSAYGALHYGYAGNSVDVVPRLKIGRYSASIKPIG